MKVKIDFALCSGHGRCYALCPDVFDEDEDGYPVLRSEEVQIEFREAARAARNNCPERAIELTETSESEPRGRKSAEL